MYQSVSFNLKNASIKTLYYLSQHQFKLTLGFLVQRGLKGKHFEIRLSIRLLHLELYHKYCITNANLHKNIEIGMLRVKVIIKMLN